MIENLVQDLPEVYQPIFGYPCLSSKVSRSCVDRLDQIERIYRALENHLKRPLRVLDLGCAQGYFSLHLAKLGASVHGVDFLDKNIALCQALALENPSFKITFAEGRIEDEVAKLQYDQYDLVLGLSVFHHLIHIHGSSFVKCLVDQLAQLSGALVLEIALQDEPLYWGASQPSDQEYLIQDVSFVHLVAHHGTHLAAIPRPLFVASNYYWIIDDLACGFDHWSYESHALAHNTHRLSRKYYFSNDFVLKHYRLDHPRGNINQGEIRKEIGFLKCPPPGFKAGKLIAAGEHSTEAWVVVQRLPGKLLLDLIREKTPIDDHKIVLTVLEQLAVLESFGLYHNDLRTWNILIDAKENETFLIDYGSISSVAEDCVWPGNLFLSFIIFLKEISTFHVGDNFPRRAAGFSPLGLPEPYSSWILSFWKKPFGEWSFRSLYQSFHELPMLVAEKELNYSPTDIWMNAIEQAVQIDFLYLKNIALQAQAAAESAELKAQQSETISKECRAQLQEIFESKCWLKTTPLQWVCSHIKRLRHEGLTSLISRK